MLGFMRFLDLKRRSDDGEETAHGGADHFEASGGGGPPGPGHEAAPDLSGAGGTEQTYYRWRKEYGGLRTDQAKRLKTLEKENARLKQVVADLALDNAILKEAAYPNC